MQHFRKLVLSQGGQALTELALVFPLLLVLALGAIEVSNMIQSYLTLSHLTREGANMISRAIASPDSALDAVISSACPLIGDGSSCSVDNSTNWEIIFSTVVEDSTSPGNYIIGERTTKGGLDQGSKIGTAVGATATLPDIDEIGPGKTLFVVEAFYQYQAITPAQNFGITFPSEPFYERAVF